MFSVLFEPVLCNRSCLCEPLSDWLVGRTVFAAHVMYHPFLHIWWLQDSQRLWRIYWRKRPDSAGAPACMLRFAWCAQLCLASRCHVLYSMVFCSGNHWSHMTGSIQLPLRQRTPHTFVLHMYNSYYLPPAFCCRVECRFRPLIPCRPHVSIYRFLPRVTYFLTN